MLNNKDIIESFWEGVPNETTIEEMAKGILVFFKYLGKDYLVDTKQEGSFRVRSMDTFYRKVERTAVLAVHRGEF